MIGDREGVPSLLNTLYVFWQAAGAGAFIPGAEIDTTGNAPEYAEAY